MNKSTNLLFSDTPLSNLSYKIKQYQNKEFSKEDMIGWSTEYIHDILAKKIYLLNEMEIYPLLCELSDGDGNYDEKIAQINRILTFQECYNYAFSICLEQNSVPDPCAVLIAYIEGKKLNKEEIRILDDFVNNMQIEPTTLQELLLIHIQLLLKTSLFFTDNDIFFEIGNAICPLKEDNEFVVFKKRIKEAFVCYCGKKSFHAAIWFKKGIHWSIIL